MPISLAHSFLEDILELRPGDVAEWCEAIVDTPSLAHDEPDLARDIDEYWPAGRRGFCEFLGIGESTLSGWLKEKRVPRHAKVAYALLLACDLLRKEVKRLTRDASDLKILKAIEGYQICRFRPDKDGIVVGEIVADRITSFKHASLLANSLASFQLLDKAKGVVNHVLEFTDRYPGSYIEELEELREAITSRTTFVFEHEEWKELFGANRHASLLDLDLGLAEPKAAVAASVKKEAEL